jgi:hypothetical protein
MLKVEFKSQRTNNYETLARIDIQEAAHQEAIYSFVDRFNSLIARHPRKSVGHVRDFYKADTAGKDIFALKSVEIWHLNAKGDKDRLVAIVSKQ